MRKHRITGLVRFAPSTVKYEGVGDWRAHEHLHRIPATSEFDWKPAESDMWGWFITHAYRLEEAVEGPETKGVKSCKPVSRCVK